MKKGETGLGGWRGHGKNGGIERRLVRKWEETEKQDAGRQQRWRKVRVEGEMEKCKEKNKDEGKRKIK